MGQVLNDSLRRHVFQRELQAARQDGHWQLLRIGGREQELDVGRRLFEGLEQRVERVRREHVYFVDQVDLVASTTRRVPHVVQQFARVLDLGAACSVHLDQVDEAPSSISRQTEHRPQGVELTPVSQFRHLAMIRAIVVLPTPRVPVNR